MKALLSSCVVGIILLQASICTAGTEGFYVGLFAGGSHISNAELSDSTGKAKVTFDPGMSAGGFVGYRADGIRFEGELAYRMIEFDTIGIGNQRLKIDADGSVKSAMVNTYLDLDRYSNWTPYFGGGIGFARMDVSSAQVNALTVWADSTDTVLAYQAAIGFNFILNTKVDLDVSYRFIGTSKPHFEQIEAEYHSHNVQVGVRYKF